MAVSQVDKAREFRALHDGPTFVIPNPWDIGSARVLAGHGFKALATSSAASASALGLKDGELTRDQALDHARQIVGATALPVSADLEGGFGDAPETVAATVRLAAEAGLVGCTIEDTTGNPAHPLYDDALAVQRIAAAAEAARGLPFPFMLTARSAQPDVRQREPRRDDPPAPGVRAGRRSRPLRAGLPDLAAVRTLCSSVKAPVNFMAGIKGKSFAVPESSQSAASGASASRHRLYRAAMTGFVDAANEVKERGTFEFLENPRLSTGDVLGLMRDG